MLIVDDWLFIFTFFYILLPPPWCGSMVNAELENELNDALKNSPGWKKKRVLNLMAFARVVVFLNLLFDRSFPSQSGIYHHRP